MNKMEDRDLFSACVHVCWQDPAGVNIAADPPKAG